MFAFGHVGSWPLAVWPADHQVEIVGSWSDFAAVARYISFHQTGGPIGLQSPQPMPNSEGPQRWRGRTLPISRTDDPMQIA
jgi:hypothetical protein